MPLIDIQLVRGALTEKQKNDLMRLVADAVVAAAGEPARRLTLVRVQEFEEGKWCLAGRPLHAADIHELFASSAAQADRRRD